MKTTLNKIRAHNPCRNGWLTLLHHLSKIAPDDEPLLIETILDVNGLDDALWCLRAVDGHDREMRLYAVWCARRVQNLMRDPRSVAALDVAERHARGRASNEERAAATRSAAAWTTRSAAAAASWAATAVETAALEASSAAGADERSAQAGELRRICRDIEAGRDPYPEDDGR